VQICLTKHKEKEKFMVIILSQKEYVVCISKKMKNLHLLKDGISLVEVGQHYGENE
jgi:hypothetical protein